MQMTPVLGAVAVTLTIAVTAGCGGGGKKSSQNTTTTKKPSVAQARAVFTTPQKTQSAVASFWTPERMKTATPQPLLTGKGEPQLSSSTSATAPKGSPLNTPPVAPSGDVQGGKLPKAGTPTSEKLAGGYPFPYSRFPYSGSLSQAPGRMWGEVTGDGQWYQNWVFVPGYNNGNSPYGVWVARDLFTTSQWFSNGDRSYDVAAAVVYPVNGRSLVSTVGGQGISFNQSRNWTYIDGGYPQAAPFNGQSLFICRAGLGGVDTFGSPAQSAIGCDMTGGSSGGGWLISVRRNGYGWVDSVNSWKYFAQPKAMYGPYQGSDAYNVFNRAQND
jgi:hypothetical protein